jgi:ATP-dependent DNA helicase RecG
MKANGSPMLVFETDDKRSYFLIRLPIHAGFISDEQVKRLLLVLSE